MTNKESKDISEKLKEIVIMRIKAASSDLKLSIGNSKSLSKDEMIDHVSKGDEIGKHIINSHLSFLKAVSSGEFTKAISSI